MDADILDLAHQLAHGAPHDPDDTVFICLSRRDMWHFMFAMLLCVESSDCLAEQGADIIERVAELVDVQKPDWRSAPPPAT